MKPLLCRFLAGAMAIIPATVAFARGGGGSDSGNDIVNFSFADTTGTVSGSFTGTLDVPDSLFLIDTAVVTSVPADFNLSGPIDLDINYAPGAPGVSNPDTIDLNAAGVPIFSSNELFDFTSTDGTGNDYELFFYGGGGTSPTVSLTESPESGSTISLTADTVDLAAAPEPSTWALLASGVIASIAFSSRRRWLYSSRR